MTRSMASPGASPTTATRRSRSTCGARSPSRMGYSGEMLARPVVGIADSQQRLQQLPPPFPGADRGGEARRARRRRAAARFPDHLAGRSVPQPDLDDVPQPDGDGRRGDDPRPADGRGGAGGRLRQDRAGAADGRGERRRARDPAARRADDADLATRASASAPAPIAAASGRMYRAGKVDAPRSTTSRAISRPPPAPAR